jgi:hypothetical protein
MELENLLIHLLEAISDLNRKEYWAETLTGDGFNAGQANGAGNAREMAPFKRPGAGPGGVRQILAMRGHGPHASAGSKSNGLRSEHQWRPETCGAIAAQTTAAQQGLTEGQAGRLGRRRKGAEELRRGLLRRRGLHASSRKSTGAMASTMSSGPTEP